MQTFRRVGSGSALAVLWVISGGAAAAQEGSAGAPDGGGKGSPAASKFAEMKVSIDVDRGRLVEVVPKLMKSVGAEFSIDADVKDALVSSHLTNVKLQTVLDVLLRVSTIPVQVTLEKGVYHFSKKPELPPEAPPPTPRAPAEPLLPPLPTTAEDGIDVHNVQTFDLLRVLNGVFGIPVSIDPSGDTGASGTSHAASFGA